MRILVIHGPNLNRTGYREKNVYGDNTLQQINNDILTFSNNHNIETEIFQSNSEGSIIDKIEEAVNKTDFLIINPGAYTHYSYAIRDAVLASNIPTIEVHMSNIYNREKFRNESVIAPVCKGQISGFGKMSYLLALKACMLNF